MLIFRNIQQDHRNGNWDQNKIILANEIKKRQKVLTTRLSLSKQKGCIGLRKNRPGGNLPVIAKFTSWVFSKEVKTSFIKAEKDGNNHTPIFILHMYSLALTM